MGALTPGHLLIVLLIAVLLFGAKKLPEAARGLGRSARILKSEISGLHDDEPTKPSPQLETKADSRPADAPRAASTTTESKPSPEA